MSEKSEKYWARRLAEQEERSQAIDDAYLKDMERELIAYQQDVISDINGFYARYAKDNKMTPAEAERYLSNNELEIFDNVNLARFRQLSLDPTTEQSYLDALSYRHRISRKEALLKEIEARTLALYGNADGLAQYVYKNMGQVYGESRIAVVSGMMDLGITARTPLLDLETVKNRLLYDWSGKNLSESVWGQGEWVYQELTNILNDGFKNGTELDDIIDDVVSKTGALRHRAETLVRTESAAFNSLGARDEMENQYVEYYKCVVTMDEKTSEKCQSIHHQDKRYRMDEYKINVTAPPFHHRCRTYMVPDFGPELDDYFEVDDNYDGPELDDILDELTERLMATVNDLNTL